jgi:hypothetical protein
MRALVVYESMFGNTHLVAEAVAAGIGADTEAVSLHDVDAARVVAADLVVVGGPTHVHGLSRVSTRKAAAETAAQPDSGVTMDPDAEGEGLREWLDALPALDVMAAAFDTRMPPPPAITGRASKGIAKRLRHHGVDLVAPPESFIVSKENVLLPDELEHATAWGRRLATTAAERLAGRRTERTG